MIPTQPHEIVQVVHDWLTQGLLTPMQALELVEEIKQEGKRALADVMKDAIKTWHDAELEHDRHMLARGI